MEAKNEIKVVKENRDVMSEIAPTNYAVSKSAASASGEK